MLKPALQVPALGLVVPGAVRIHAQRQTLAIGKRKVSVFRDVCYLLKVRSYGRKTGKQCLDLGKAQGRTWSPLFTSKCFTSRTTLSVNARAVTKHKHEIPARTKVAMTSAASRYADLRAIGAVPSDSWNRESESIKGSSKESSNEPPEFRFSTPDGSGPAFCASCPCPFCFSAGGCHSTMAFEFCQKSVSIVWSNSREDLGNAGMYLSGRSVRRIP